MLVCALRVLLGLSRVLLALHMVILAVRLGSGAMGLCRSFVMLGRLVVFVFHVESSLWPANSGSTENGCVDVLFPIV
jgi:hypothetical protein